ncbi:peptidoglycan-binding domain-containing protein [Microcoleus vaginatus]|uniref:peptidoglycan-binding domain-containing protein n=1 Tax=Microcoleus vaginatus TaxID=119532 RepID=UPI00403F5397
MSQNLTASWNNAREVPSLLFGWSLCGLFVMGLIASTPAAAQLPTSEQGNINSPIAQTGARARPTLKLGSRSSEVIELQAALKLLGFYADTVDGIFSQSTARAVSQFQEAAGSASRRNSRSRYLEPAVSGGSERDRKPERQRSCNCRELRD